METNKFLHITGEPACQQPALGEAEAACSSTVWLIPQGIVGSAWRRTRAARGWASLNSLFFALTDVFSTPPACVCGEVKGIFWG